MLTVGYNGSSPGNVPLLTVRDIPSALIMRLLLESVCLSKLEEYEWAQLGKDRRLELETERAERLNPTVSCQNSEKDSQYNQVDRYNGITVCLFMSSIVQTFLRKKQDQRCRRMDKTFN